MAKEVISVRIDKEVKKEAERILSELGLNISTAINVFLKAVLREKGIPFPLKVEKDFLTSKVHKLEKLPKELEGSLEDLESGKVKKLTFEELENS